jgi:hypothetical protein
MIHSTYIDLVSENAPSDNDDEDSRLTEEKVNKLIIALNNGDEELDAVNARVLARAQIPIQFSLDKIDTEKDQQAQGPPALLK